MKMQKDYRFKTFSASSVEIDKKGIATSIFSLIENAQKFFRSQFDYCLIDGNYNVKKLTSTGTVVKGDQKCFSIASASIVAKVDRDQQMDFHASTFPQYGFESHKGYGTKTHLEAIIKYGPCSIHRYSYQPIKKYVR